MHAVQGSFDAPIQARLSDALRVFLTSRTLHRPAFIDHTEHLAVVMVVPGFSGAAVAAAIDVSANWATLGVASRHEVEFQ